MYGDRERARVGAASASATFGVREGGTGNNAAGTMAYFGGPSIRRTGTCVLTIRDEASAGAGSVDATKPEAVRIERAPVTTEETTVHVAADGDIEADRAGAQQPAGGVSRRHYGDVEERFIFLGGRIFCGKSAPGVCSLAEFQPRASS